MIFIAVDEKVANEFSIHNDWAMANYGTFPPCKMEGNVLFLNFSKSAKSYNHHKVIANYISYGLSA